MYFLPIVTSTIAIGLVWSWIYSPSSGLLNELLGVFGIPPQRWIADPFWAMPSIIGMSVWQGLPANTIIFLAGLQAIPLAYYDAASVDGGGRWARLRHVTLPLLTPSIFFTGLLSLIGSVQVFDQVFVLSNPGKPTSATITIVYFIYEAGFRNFKMGYASAASWVLFLIVAVLTFIYFRSQRRWVPTSEGASASAESRALEPGRARARPVVGVAGAVRRPAGVLYARADRRRPR